MAKMLFLCFVILVASHLIAISEANTPKCPANHTYAQTVSGCPAACAVSRVQRPTCLSIFEKPGCYCSPGYILKSRGSKRCIKPQDC